MNESQRIDRRTTEPASVAVVDAAVCGIVKMRGSGTFHVRRSGGLRAVPGYRQRTRACLAPAGSVLNLRFSLNRLQGPATIRPMVLIAITDQFTPPTGHGVSPESTAAVCRSPVFTRAGAQPGTGAPERPHNYRAALSRHGDPTTDIGIYGDGRPADSRCNTQPVLPHDSRTAGTSLPAVTAKGHHTGTARAPTTCCLALARAISGAIRLRGRTSSVRSLPARRAGQHARDRSAST